MADDDFFRQATSPEVRSPPMDQQAPQADLERSPTASGVSDADVEMVRTVTGRGADACRRALEFADGEVERAKRMLLEGALPDEGGSEPEPESVVTRTRSSSVDSRSPQPRPPAKAAAPSPAAPRPGVGGDDLRTWLGRIGLAARTKAVAEALQLQPDGEPVTQDLVSQPDGSIEAAALKAGLEYFERRRFAHAVEECRAGHPPNASFPAADKRQSVTDFLKEAKLPKYRETLEAAGLVWGDLKWVAQDDLEGAGMKQFHAARLLRHRKQVKFQFVAEEGVPPSPQAQPEQQDGTRPTEPEPEPFDGALQMEPEPEEDDDSLHRVSASEPDASYERSKSFEEVAEDDRIASEDLEVTKELLGEGQYGKVWGGLLQDRHGHCVAVAVKMMGEVDGREVQNYEREISRLRVIARLCSKVCRLHGTCVKDGKHCIVMKRYKTSLAKLIQDQPGHKFATAAALDYARQISQSLIELHENRVIMLDLKPANVLIDEHQEAFLADFGISTIIKATQSLAPNTSIKGTLHYMAPEAWDKDKVSTYKTDMWSLGCTVLELLTGEVPWSGLGQPEIMMEVVMKQQRPAFPDDLHADVKALLERCLSHDPEQRPSSQEFYEEAQKLQRSVLGDEVVRALSPKELQVLRWVREDQNLDAEDSMSHSEAVATAASKLGVTASDTDAETLKAIEKAIHEITRRLEQDESNDFRGGMFLSHFQGTAGPAVMLLKRRLELACPFLEGRLWYDKDQTPTVEEMRLGVKRCSYFVLFLSKDVLLRPFVRKEIRWAIRYRKQIRLVWHQEGEHAVNSFDVFFANCATEVGGDGDDIDIAKIFERNVGIPYYTHETFRDASLGVLLKGCGFKDEAARLHQMKRPVLPTRGIKVQLLANPHTGSDQAEFVKLELESMCSALRGNCTVGDVPELDTKSGHLVVYVTKEVFQQANVVAAITRAAKFKRPITCLVDTDTRHGGVSMEGNLEVLPPAATEGLSIDIIAPVQGAKVIPFYKDKDFRTISLQAVLQEMASKQDAEPSSDGIHTGNREMALVSPRSQDSYGTCLDRPFVQMEIRAAREANKNIITVYEDDRRKRGYFSYDLASVKYHGTEWEELLHIDATVYRRDTFEAEAMIKKILHRADAVSQACVAKSDPINQPGIWDFFLSHGQATSSDQVMALAMRLKKAGRTVWHDMDMQDRGTEAMMEGVAHCRTLIVFLAGDKGLFEAPQSPVRLTGTASDDTRAGTLARDWEHNYDQQEELGAGQMSIVHKSFDKKHHRICAVKIFEPPPPLVAFDEEQSKALQRTSVIGSRVMHVNIAACYDYLFTPTKFYQALELVEGPSLQQLLDDEGPMREAVAAGFMSSCLDGLAAIHAQHVVHQDITLKNIKLSRDNVPKIMDFGLARATVGADDDDEPAEVELGTLMLTDSTEVAGDPDYKSPEAWKGDKTVDYRSDIWSIGVCLCILLTGQPPFKLPAGMTDKRHLIGEVLYKMDPAPDVRDIIEAEHKKAQHPARPWLVSDQTAAVIATALDKDTFARYRSALVMKSQLDEAVEAGGATKCDIFLAYSREDEAFAQELHQKLRNARALKPSQERLSVYLANPDEDDVDVLCSTTAFCPVISPAALAQMKTLGAEDTVADVMLTRCQIALGVPKLVVTAPVLYGASDTDADQVADQMLEEAGLPQQTSRSTRAKADELVALLPRLRAARSGISEQTVQNSMARIVLAASSIKMWEEGEVIDACVEKMIVVVEQAKKVAAARKAQEQYSTMMVSDLAPIAEETTSVGDLDLYSEAGEEPAVAAGIPSVPADVRERVEYQDAAVKAQLKDFSWLAKDVAMALKRPHGVERDFARATAKHTAASVNPSLALAVEQLFEGQQKVHTVIAGLDDPAVALILDILDRASLPLPQIEGAVVANERVLEPHDETFADNRRPFYAIAMLATNQDESFDTLLERCTRKFLRDEFAALMESKGWKIASGMQSIFDSERSIDVVVRDADPSSSKLLRLVFELARVVATEYGPQTMSAHASSGQSDQDILTLIAYLTDAGEPAWRQRLQTQLVDKVLHSSPDLVQKARSWWGGARTGTDHVSQALADLLHMDADALAAKAERLVLLLEVQCSNFQEEGVVSRVAKAMMESHKSELRRIAQLSVPAVAEATGPRFCAGGHQAERVHAETHILAPLGQKGWPLLTPVRKLWAGERDLDVLAHGCDGNTRTVLEKILSQVVETPDSVPDMQDDVQDALGKMLVELQVAARLAVEEPSSDRESGRAHLLKHVNKRLEAQRVHLHDPIARIFDGARDETDLTAGLDHIDSAAVRKILTFITSADCLSESWPRWHVLNEPSNQTQKIIDEHSVEWKRIAQLAVPAVAKAARRRFCDGGIQAEKDAVNAHLIDRLEARGWSIRKGIQRIWDGDRDLAVVAQGADEQDTHVLRHILSLVVEKPDDDPDLVRSPERQRMAQRALAEGDNAFRIAAKLAVDPYSEAREKARTRLMVYVYGTLEEKGLEIADGISRILAGERNEENLTMDTDDIDTECLLKVLQYVTMLEQGQASADLWPTVDVLSQPPRNVQDFIRRHQLNFERLARATTPREQREVRYMLDQWEESGWELRAPVDRMWRGEREEHAVVGNADHNSAHVVRAILQTFISGGAPPSFGGGHRLGGGAGGGGAPPLQQWSEQDVQDVMSFVPGCSEEVARTCLDAQGGNVERAAGQAMDMVFGG